MSDDGRSLGGEDAGDVRTLLNLARGAKGAALLCFLLPWVTVSCGNDTLVRASGFDLATGSARPEKGVAGAGRLGDAAEAARSAVVDPYILEAANLIVLALVLTFLLPRLRAAAIALGACAAAAALIAWDVLVNLPRLLAERTGGSGGGSEDGPEARLLNQLMPEIAVRAEVGVWATLAALAAAAALLAAVIARSRRRRGPS